MALKEFPSYYIISPLLFYVFFTLYFVLSSPHVWLNWLEHNLMHQKVAGLLPGQDDAIVIKPVINLLTGKDQREVQLI